VGAVAARCTPPSNHSLYIQAGTDRAQIVVLAFEHVRQSGARSPNTIRWEMEAANFRRSAHPEKAS